MEVRSERLGRNTPDLQSVERDSNTGGQEEYEGPGPDVHRPSEMTPERTSGGDQDGGGAGDPAQSGKSRGTCRCSGYNIVRINHYQRRREGRLTGLSVVSQLWSILRRDQPKYFLPSKLS